MFFNLVVVTTLLHFLIICIELRQSTNAALISGQRDEFPSNESSVLSLIDSVNSNNESFTDNSVLTAFQGIKLKELRKLARLAGHEHPETITDFDAEMCYSDDCLEAANEFYTSMDFSKDPCTEWEKFACEWRTLSTKSALDQLSSLTLKVEKQVNDILQDPNAETEAIEYAQEYFRACLVWFQGIDKINHITKYLTRFGNWPLLTGSDFEGDWLVLLAEIIKIAPENTSPFVFKFVAAAINNKKIVLQIDIGSTYLEMDVEDIRDLLNFLRKNFSVSTEQELADINEMQRSMQKLSVVKFDSTGVNIPSLITLEDLQGKIKTKFNLMKLVQAVFSGTDLKISGKTEVLINEEHLVKFVTMIETVSETALVNVLFLQLAILMLSDATNEMEQGSFFQIANYKRSHSLNPMHHCILETSEVFSYALSDEYLRRHYHLKTDKTVNNLVESVKTGFISLVDSIKWLQTSSQDFIKEKIKNVEFLIGYPKWILNNVQLVSYYSNLKLNGNKSDEGVYISYRNAVISWLNGKTWTMKLNDDPMDGWNYKQSNGFIGDTNVEYISNLNQIRIPAGILQAPMFSDDFPGFINFGGIGSIVAREMAHIIDTKGIHLNSEGESGTWFDEKSYKSYISWSKKLLEEWESDKTEISLNEKIINVFAYHITVRGYKDYLMKIKKDNGDELKLPGLATLQPEKLLQIKYTNALCEGPFIKQLRVHSGHQSSSKYPVSQTKYFSHLFDCGEESFNTAFDLANLAQYDSPKM